MIENLGPQDFSRNDQQVCSILALRISGFLNCYMDYHVKTTVLIILVLVLCIFAPNLIWFARSTAHITNGGTVTLSSVTVDVDGKETKLGKLHPGESRFILLPKSGDATYRVNYGKAEYPESVCQEYVESEMYHVETILESSHDSGCAVSLPLLSELFILKVI